MAFARHLEINPWHSIPEHRPRGNRIRAHQRTYDALARYRSFMNHVEHIGPTGNEVSTWRVVASTSGTCAQSTCGNEPHILVLTRTALPLTVPGNAKLFFMVVE